MAARKVESASTRIARRLRRNQTDAEQKLWKQLRNRQLAGAKFKRQVPVEGFVADFFCFDAMLIIEVDGGQHDVRVEQDEARTQKLNDAGYRVVRFWNNDVLNNIKGVLEEIVRVLDEGSDSPHPNPLPRERG